MKRLFAAYPGIFLLVALAFTIDVVLIASTGALWRNSSFALGSAGAAIFLLGSASILRFVVFRNRIHLAISWVFIVFLWFGWFVIKALTQSPQYASFLLIMCLVAAFKTMRLEQSEEEKNAAEQRGADIQHEVEENEGVRHEHSEKNQKSTDIQAPSTPPEKTTEPIFPSAILATSSTGPDTGDNQSGLRSLKQVLAIMAAIGCLVALWDMPDDYDKVLRFIVVAACGVIIWDIQKSNASDARKTWFTVAFGMLAVFFNPIMPIELDDDTWRWVSLTGAVGFTLLEIGKSAAISLAIVATVSLVAIDYAKEQKQIAYNNAFEENMKRIRDEENKKKLEEQEKREKYWAEREAERVKKEQIAQTKSELFMAEWESNKAKNEKIEKERWELESQKYLEAERKRKKFIDKQIRESDARIAAHKKQRDAALAKKEFTIVGQVKNPGTYDYGLLTLNIFKAIEKAGGWTRQANMKEIKVKRTINGENQTLIVNTRMLTDKPWGSFDIMAGDVIEVSKK